MHFSCLYCSSFIAFPFIFYTTFFCCVVLRISYFYAQKNLFSSSFSCFVFFYIKNKQASQISRCVQSFLCFAHLFKYKYTKKYKIKYNWLLTFPLLHCAKIGLLSAEHCLTECTYYTLLSLSATREKKKNNINFNINNEKNFCRVEKWRTLHAICSFGDVYKTTNWVDFFIFIFFSNIPHCQPLFIILLRFFSKLIT